MQGRCETCGAYGEISDSLADFDGNYAYEPSMEDGLYRCARCWVPVRACRALAKAGEEFSLALQAFLEALDDPYISKHLIVDELLEGYRRE